MQYEQFRPHPELASWVECYWRLTGEPTSVAQHAAPRPQRILPDGSIEIVLHLGDPFLRVDAAAPVVQPRVLFVGQMVQPIRVAPTGRTCAWGVRLHPWAAAIAAGMPAYELTGRIERAEDVCPPLARDLVDALNEARHDVSREHGAPSNRRDAARAGRDVLQDGDESRRDGAAAARGVRALDRVLRRHLARAVPLNPLVVAAGGMLLRRPRPIAEMARRLGVSARHLERAFQHAVGLTPKMFARISRFQRVAAVLDDAPPGVLASVALDCGYYDQSHLVRDVRAFAGDTPVALRDALDGELADYFLRARRASHFSKIDRLHVE